MNAVGTDELISGGVALAVEGSSNGLAVQMAIDAPGGLVFVQQVSKAAGFVLAVHWRVVQNHHQVVKFGGPSVCLL